MLIVQNATEPASLRNALVDMVAAGATDIRVAAAYVTIGGANILLSAVADAVGPAVFEAMPKTLVTSFDFGLTEPQALQQWRALANSTVLVSGAQKLAQGSLTPQRAFHPKLYLFGSNLETCSMLVGSANLTGRGFSVNMEAAWVQQGVLRTAADAAFDKACFETTDLTDDMLTSYTALRQAQPPPPGLRQEVEPVDPPQPFDAAALPVFRDAVETGAINPADYTAIWVQGGGLSGGSGNQLELPREGRRFFGFDFDAYEYAHNLTIGQLVLRRGAHSWIDRPLTWHGSSRMERVNLPTIAQGGVNYTAAAIMFRRLTEGSFELIVTPWEGDLARSWRQASAQRQTLFRLGTAATSRIVGLL